jgi:AcrR family transcriptional regulator
MTSTRFSGTRPFGQPVLPAAARRPGVRAQILEAALVEFAERGFGEASLAAIARKLGVTAPLVLYHFGSKANLWREAVEVLCAGLASAVESAVEDGRNLDPRSALQLLVRRLVLFFAGNRAAYRLLRDQGGIDSDRADWLTCKHLKPIVAQIESVYRRAVENGVVKSAPFETTFFMILGAASCYLESRALVSHLFGSADEGPEWASGYADQVVALCFQGLSAESRSWSLPHEQMLVAVA